MKTVESGDSGHITEVLFFHFFFPSFFFMPCPYVCTSVSVCVRGIPCLVETVVWEIGCMSSLHVLFFSLVFFLSYNFVF